MLKQSKDPPPPKKKTKERPKDLSSPRTLETLHHLLSRTYKRLLGCLAADAQTGNVLLAVRTSQSENPNLELDQEL